MATHQDLVNQLRDLCANDTQTNVARRLGFGIGYINDILRGRKKVSRKLAAKLGYSAFTATEYIPR